LVAENKQGRLDASTQIQPQEKTQMKKLGLVAALMLGGLLAGSNISNAQDTNQPPAPKKKGPTIERILDRMT